ncbi:MAG: glycosyltransferase family 2 protein [Bacteroidales bacterium]|nr:glycosyltransferase family 2 protein [Bacteroidales bacterium]
MKTLTFLIPCYNVAGCVSHCIDSMLVEDIIDDIEILLVNDGSKDSTLDILRDYEKRFPDTIRVIDKENGGWGTAINLGIKEARGKYLKEVDADDWVSTENLKSYVDYLKSSEVDYIATDYTEFFKADNRYDHHGYHEDVYSRPMPLNDFWEHHSAAWDFPIHAITYKTQMLRDAKLSVGDRYYGDIEYNLYPLPFVQSICVLPINVTVYFRGSDEQSTSTKGYAKHYKDYVQMSQRLTLFYQGLPSTMQRELYAFIKGTVQGSLNKAYTLMMSPVYAGKTKGVSAELRQYNMWLKMNNKELYTSCGHQRKHGIAYIRIWRWLGINLMLIK